MRVEKQSDCGFGIADCGLLQPNPNAEIRNPKSVRRGLSLTEVLISMGILTLGLLGVASVFPVGSFYMQKAEISDRGSAIAQSVMSDIMARGMLNPWAWYVMVPPNPPNLFFTLIDGKYAPVTQPAAPGRVVYTFTRPFGEALSAGLQQSADKAVLAKQFGSAFVIDPLYASAAANSVGNNSKNISAYAFPATAYAKYPWPNSTYYGTHGWDPWRASGSVTTSNEKTWPIRRVTFQQSDGWALDRTMADSLFRGNDDLTTDLPPRDDRPAQQNWDTVKGAATPLARQWTGDYSWIVSVVPSTNAARDGMVRNPEGFAYDVSVVVFYKRTLPATVPASAQDLYDAAATERMVGAKVMTTGPNGGELLLTDMKDILTDVTDSKKNASPFEQLKTGQWIMLCGPHPNSNMDLSSTPPTGDPRFVLSWYQVLSVDKEGNGITNFDPEINRVVAVRGGEWPWKPATALTDYNHLSNDLCVGIFRGAVAVHTKTLRLESKSGSAMGSAMKLHAPAAITPPPYGI